MLDKLFKKGGGRDEGSQSAEPLPRNRAVPVRAGIFTRTQLNDKGEVVNDPDKQEETCRKYANKRGYIVAQVYRDESVSVEDDRPELRRLRTAIWTRNLDVVIATTADRLYVDTLRLVQFAKEADLMSVRLEFVKSQLDHDALVSDNY